VFAAIRHCANFLLRSSQRFAVFSLRTGVFAVLNDSRAAHGLSRLAVPAMVSQIDSGLSAADAPFGSVARLQQESQQARRRIGGAGGGGGFGHASSASSAMDMEISEEPPESPDMAEQIESLFQRLGVDPRAQQQRQEQQQQQRPPTDSFTQWSPFSAAASSSSSFHRASPPPQISSSVEHLSDHHLASMLAETSLQNGTGGGFAQPPHAVHYPSMRTVLPAMSGGGFSSTSLEEIHSPWSQMRGGGHGSTSAGAASSSSASAAQDHAAAMAAVENATPLLALSGREDLLDMAYDSQDSVICTECAALVPTSRFQAHRKWWCQVEE
jgi:hypothetical protein